MSSKSGVLYLRAQTSVHPGAGSSVGTIDLPIQRERYTRWPTIQGSSIKGVLREAYRIKLLEDNPGDAAPQGTEKKGNTRQWADEQSRLTTIFGKVDGESGYAGSVAVTDARILAFPVRSARGVFAWVTCPSVLKRVRQDYEMAGIPCSLSELTDVADGEAVLAEEAVQKLCFPNTAPTQNAGSVLVLEDILMTGNTKLAKHAREAATLLEASGASDVKQRLAVVSDDAFGHFVMHCTEVATRIALDYDTKRVKGPALFVVEMLPAETILYSVLLATDRLEFPVDPVTEISSSISSSLKRRGLLQIGGEETTGKGWCWAKVVTA